MDMFLTIGADLWNLLGLPLLGLAAAALVIGHLRRRYDAAQRRESNVTARRLSDVRNRDA